MITTSVDPFHLRVARIALAVAKEEGFALGGGLALIAHGVLDRPTEDIDLFSDARGEVSAALRKVRAALEAEGIDVEVDEEDSELGEIFDGMTDVMAALTAFRTPDDEYGVELSLGHLHRTHSPVVLDIGPVLHLDDLRAAKVSALIARAEARDLVDVGAFLATHTPNELLDLARRGDPGIEDADVRAVGRRLDRTPDRRFAAFGMDAEAVAELRRRFSTWPRP
jgi:hypothetical protein